MFQIWLFDEFFKGHVKNCAADTYINIIDYLHPESTGSLKFCRLWFKISWSVKIFAAVNRQQGTLKVQGPWHTGDPVDNTSKVKNRGGEKQKSYLVAVYWFYEPQHNRKIARCLQIKEKIRDTKNCQTKTLLTLCFFWFLLFLLR